MIHLDTNVLCEAIHRSSPLADQLRKSLQRGESFSTSAIAWSEFLSAGFGPEKISEVRVLIEDRIVEFGVKEAATAAALFRETGGKRASRPDCFIAATAICATASLMTRNRKDFAPFIIHGLKLV